MTYWQNSHLNDKARVRRNKDMAAVDSNINERFSNSSMVKIQQLQWNAAKVSTNIVLL